MPSSREFFDANTPGDTDRYFTKRVNEVLDEYDLIDPYENVPEETPLEEMESHPEYKKAMARRESFVTRIMTEFGL